MSPRGERTRNTKAAAFNETAGNGKNLLGKEGDVKRLGDGRGTRENVQNGLVARFDGYDGSGGSQDIQVLNEVRGTKVCANADIFYDSSGRQKSLGITEDTREIKRATRRWFLAERNEDILGSSVKKWRKEWGPLGWGMTNAYLDGGDMGSLVLLDDRDLRDGNIARLETDIHEIGRLEFAQCFLVEFCFELFENGSEF